MKGCPSKYTKIIKKTGEYFSGYIEEMDPLTSKLSGIYIVIKEMLMALSKKELSNIRATYNITNHMAKECKFPINIFSWVTMKKARRFQEN